MTSPACLILGGTGTLAAAAEDLARSGVDVTVTCRRPELAPRHWSALGIRVLALDRDDAPGIDALVGDGVDGIVDGQCYTPGHAADLARWSRASGSTIMLSARAVYVDAAGRHANSEEAPQWPGPTPETTATMEHHGEPYASRLGYGANKAEAERVLAAHGERVSVLRAARIHGPSTRRVREWPLVRSVLEGARAIAVARADEIGTLTSTASLAQAVAACLRRPGSRVVNVGDAPAVTNLRAARILAGALRDGDTTATGLAVRPAAPGEAGALPGAWATGQELDLGALRELVGPPPEPAATLARTARWVRSIARRGADGAWELPAQFDGG
ncbi:NAD(P)-dependent oxidoreductase [Brachybacterium sp. ACRRE]|uniref:NAD-dependent epimerase/dehydratase family protein n=1 Tax=Brachybacterium sp. ACRRE TaxID=2918184 RepID=UPI001EF1B0AA|nr:hypothetical protein [Brachybacterium sp. ACRRE]MCG7308458.1 hypothetical protein [Brachybacterium sp. ACRRE]